MFTKTKKVITIALLICFTILAGCNGPARNPIPKNKINESQYKKNEIKQRKPLLSEPIISLYINETGEKKWIKMEEYLLGVIAAEMDPNAPEAALEAQAIIARTFTYKKKLEGGVKKYNTDASTNTAEFQAYNTKWINPKIKKAVKKTRGVVIYYKNTPVETYFNRDNGGVTSDPNEGLASEKKAPYLRAGIKDEGSKSSPPDVRSWTAKIPLYRLQATIRALTGKYPGNISNVSVAKKGPSGRAVTLRFNGMVVSAPKFRLGVGSDIMKSTLVSEIYINGSSLIIKGKGHGHGVGLSQIGAVYLAKKNKSSQDIVNFYYSDIAFWRLWK